MIDADRWRVLGPLLDRALELRGDERAAWLAELRVSSPAHAEELMALLSDERLADRRGFLLTPPVAPPTLSLVGTRLGEQYEIERELGRGGMATVYLARDLRHRRPVAVKVLHPELSAAVGAERFRREVELTAGLQHPHILPLFDSGRLVVPGALDSSVITLLYYVMPYVEGETLRERLAREGRLATDEAVRLTREVAEALAYAHARRIVHRDVKPENILLHEGHALVADFGIALAFAHTSGERMTRPGVTIGTPQYMAPEQVTETSVDARADVYALGVVTYEMLAGEPPFRGTTVHEVLAEVLTAEPNTLASVRPDIPRHVETAIRRAIARQPADRFSSTSTFVAALVTPTPDGPPGSTGALSRRSVGRLSGRGAIVLAIAVVVVAVLGLVVRRDVGGVRETLARYTVVTAGRSADQRSVVVLPFENVGGAPADEYFSDGLTEELIATLSQLRSLRVAARTSSFAFKGQTRDIRDIARTLDVASVLVGSVRMHAGRIRVTAQLVDASTGLDLWSGTYDERRLADVFDIQSDLALRITRALEANLSPAERGRLARRPTESIEAYTLYLKGRFAWGQRDENLMSAVDYFERAIAVDPRYARAYAGLASVYPPLAVHGYVDPRAVRARARDAARHAVALDDSLAEAHTALAAYLHVFEWDWAGAEREYRRAIALDPDEPTAHSWYGLLLEELGRFDEAIAERRRALDLDPLAPNSGWGSALRRAGRFELARDAYGDVVDHHPGYWLGHDGLGRTLDAMGAYAEAVPAFERATALAGRTSEAKAGLARTLALVGRRAEAERLVGELRGDAERTGIYHPVVAPAMAALGDTGGAMAWLEKAYDQRNPALIEIDTDARFAQLRGDPRFLDLLRRVGFRR